MKRRRIDRSIGRYQSGEHFARLPREVLEGAAYRALPDWAKIDVVALAAQYRGARNGDISLTWLEARALGVSSEWKLRAGMKLAVITGLVEITRPGGNVAGGEKEPTLYALGWLPIEKSEKFEAPPGSILKAPDRWATWTRPDDWPTVIEAERRRAQGKKKGHHTRGEQAAPPVRGDKAHSRYTREAQPRNFDATHGGAISRDLGRGVESRALLLIDSQPHLSDFDIAKALNWKIDAYRVATLREKSGRGRTGS